MPRSRPKELVQAHFGAQPEALEVPKRVEAEAGDCAFEATVLVVMFGAIVSVTPWSVFSMPGTQAGDLAGHLLEIAMDNRVPAVLVGDSSSFLLIRKATS